MDFFAANIRHLRLQKGLKQHDFQELGFSRTQWNNYEKLVSRPKVGDVVKISNFFGITETELMHTDLREKSGDYSNGGDEFTKPKHAMAEAGQPYGTLKSDLIESLQLNVDTLKQLIELKDNQILSLKEELALLEEKRKSDL